MNTTLNYSPNFDVKKRRVNEIKFIVFHYTGMKKENQAITKLTNTKSKLSSHYLIKNNGEVIILVPDLYVAWHAGISSWKNYKSINKYSIGIEISNPGHDNGYRKFSLNQINSIIKLLRYLVKKYNIKKHNILGHSDIAPNRKKDPGEKFPWKILAKKNLCIWHDLKENQIKIKRNLKIQSFEEEIFLNNLYIIGYPRIAKKNYISNKRNLIRAFQRRFRQSLINGKIDQECFLISKNILKFCN